MRTKIYLDKKMKCDLPETINVDKFIQIIRVYLFDGEWKSFEIRKEDKCVKSKRVCTQQKAGAKSDK